MGLGRIRSPPRLPNKMIKEPVRPEDKRTKAYVCGTVLLSVWFLIKGREPYRGCDAIPCVPFNSGNLWFFCP